MGKTSIAAAHAVKSAREGKRTLLFSADKAHNLSDLFGKRIGREETRIAPELYALEADPEYMMEHEYQDMVRAVENLPGSGAPRSVSSPYRTKWWWRRREGTICT